MARQSGAHLEPGACGFANRGGQGRSLLAVTGKSSEFPARCREEGTSTREASDEKGGRRGFAAPKVVNIYVKAQADNPGRTTPIHAFLFLSGAGG